MDLEDRRSRREQRRRQIRRRRMLALGAIAAVVVLAAAILALGSGGGTAHHASPSAGAPRTSSARKDRSTTAAGSVAVAKGPPGHLAVPILMYHVIAPPPAGAPFPGLYVEPREFAEQMQALKDAGWHAVTPDQVEAYWRRGAPLRRGQADRAELRQRLPVPVHAGAARAPTPGLGRGGEHPADRAAALAGRPRPGGDPGPGVRGLGARHAGHSATPT